MFSAQYRFFLDVFFAAAFIFFHYRTRRNQALAIYSVAVLTLALIFTTPGMLKKFVPSFRVGEFIGGFTWKQVWEPQDYHHLEYETFTLGNLNFNVVKGYPYSFNTPLPAISPYSLLEYKQAGIFPQKIGSSLADGFFWKKMTAEQQKELDAIIKELQLRQK